MLKKRQILTQDWFLTMVLVWVLVHPRRLQIPPKCGVAADMEEEVNTMVALIPNGPKSCKKLHSHHTYMGLSRKIWPLPFPFLLGHFPSSAFVPSLLHLQNYVLTFLHYELYSFKHFQSCYAIFKFSPKQCRWATWHPLFL